MEALLFSTASRKALLWYLSIISTFGSTLEQHENFMTTRMNEKDDSVCVSRCFFGPFGFSGRCKNRDISGLDVMGGFDISVIIDLVNENPLNTTE